MISTQIFDSFAAIPPAWQELCGNDDLAMDLRVLSVFQRTLAGQCRCWGLMLSDEAGRALACAALCLFPTELIETNHPTIIRARDTIRRFWPGFARLNVLFCGLPIPSGSTHLRIREGADTARITAEISRAMQALAQREGGRLLIFKELNASDAPLANALTAQGYIRGGIPPMHLLDNKLRSAPPALGATQAARLNGASRCAPRFTDFPHYRDALKSRYRAQILRSQKKLEAAGFEIISGRGAAFFAAHFDAHLHQLYVNVQRQAAQKLELLPPAFFRELAEALGDEILLTLISRAGRAHAFTFSLTRGHTHYNLYSGLDYAQNHAGDLYFNLFYHDMDEAFRAGATSLHLGQTSDAFKARLGSRTEPLSFYAHARPTWLNPLLRRVAKLAFPKAAEVETHHVFSKGT